MYSDKSQLHPDSSHPIFIDRLHVFINISQWFILSLILFAKHMKMPTFKSYFTFFLPKVTTFMHFFCSLYFYLAIYLASISLQQCILEATPYQVVMETL